jgi:hypothetical protein
MTDISPKIHKWPINMKRCWLLLVIKEMQIKTTRRSTSIHESVYYLKKKQNKKPAITEGFGKSVKKLKPL